MPPEEPAERIAWQPFTPGGVAAFATASAGRLLLIQALAGVVISLLLTWALFSAWSPVVDLAVEQLPENALVQAGHLAWADEEPVQLAANRFLGVSVDLEHRSITRPPSHLFVEFGRSTVRIYSFLGYLEFPYSRAYQLSLSRRDVSPWWGAWRPALAAITTLTLLISLLCTWRAMAAVGAFPIRLFSFLVDRDLTLRQSRRFCGAALIPGAFLMLAGVGAYRFGLFDVPQLAVTFAAHFFVSAVFIVVSLPFLPRKVTPATKAANPFSAPPIPEHNKAGD